MIETFFDLVNSLNINMIVQYVPTRPNLWVDNWKADHYKCTMIRKINGKKRQMTLYFSKGFGHKGGEPDTHEVLETLLLDMSISYYSFDDFMGEFGYSEYKKAYGIYKATLRNNNKLSRFLGAETIKALEETLYN